SALSGMSDADRARLEADPVQKKAFVDKIAQDLDRALPQLQASAQQQERSKAELLERYGVKQGSAGMDFPKGFLASIKDSDSPQFKALASVMGPEKAEAAR